jgi:hypothetical protein
MSRLKQLLSFAIVTAVLGGAPCPAAAEDAPDMLAALTSAGAVPPLDPSRKAALAEELDKLQDCANGRKVSVNDSSDHGGVAVFIVKLPPGQSLPCGHGTACYDPRSDRIFIDDDALNAPFVSRSVGTQWISRSDDDSRVRHYRQFVFLHEEGHMQLHREELRALNGALPKPERRRTMEEEADAFALQCMVRYFEAPENADAAASTEAEGQHRSQVIAPSPSTGAERAAMAIADMIVEADIALTYADQVSPYEQSSEYRSFIDRSAGLLTDVRRFALSSDVKTYLDIAEENLGRMKLSAAAVVAELRDDRVDTKIAKVAFDKKGLLILGDDRTLLRLSYDYLRNLGRNPRNLGRNGTTRPIRAVFEHVCGGGGDNGSGSSASIMVLNDQVLLHGAEGLFSCDRNRWVLDPSWRARGSATWSEVTTDPASPAFFLAKTSDGAYAIQGATETLAITSSGELIKVFEKAVGAHDCEMMHDLSYQYARRTASFKCRVSGYRIGVCRLLQSTATLSDCRLLQTGAAEEDGFEQAGVFVLSPDEQTTRYVSVASNFDPTRSRPGDGWRLKVLFYDRSSEPHVVSSYPFIEDRIPRDQDAIKWLSVMHPPLAFCVAGRGPALVCSADRESAYYFDSTTETLRPIFHPAYEMPVLGEGFAVVHGLGRYYVFAL